MRKTVNMLRRLSEYKGVIAHFVAWGIYFCAPFFIMPFTELEMTDRDRLGFIIPPLSVMFVFYANYLVYINRFLMRKHSVVFALCNILTIAVAMCVVSVTLGMPEGPQMMPPPDGFGPGAPPEKPPFGFRLKPVMENVIIYILAIGIGTAIRMTEKWQAAEQAGRELEHERVIAELQSLKNQLNPHFLFNTLNNIYSFIRTDAAQAQRTMEEFCQLLRYVLYECDKPTVKLSDELGFVGNYIELMRVRKPQDTKLTISLPENIPDCEIAPCLFIMLIENAFKHGARNHPDSMISIRIRIEDGKLICEIENSCMAGNIDNPESSNGIGLENLRRRLMLLYPDSHSLECGRYGDNYRAYLCIDLWHQLSV